MPTAAEWSHTINLTLSSCTVSAFGPYSRAQLLTGFPNRLLLNDRLDHPRTLLSRMAQAHDQPWHIMTIGIRN